MADIMFSWSDLEENIKNNKVGYFHAKLTKFNEHKERHPEYIWIVRKEEGRLWLIACLKVSNTKPKNFPVKPHKNFIYYDVENSFFFRNTNSLREKTDILLEDICSKMTRGNMQGISASMLLENEDKRKLEEVIKEETRISFKEFSEKLKSGEISGPPYRIESVKAR